MSKNIKFIAEISSNHNQSLKRCKKFIDVASNIGCYAIKFQLFKIDELFSKEVLKKKSLIEIEKSGNYQLNIYQFYLRTQKKKD